MSSFFCSWSGGKDSCLALYKAAQMIGSKAKFLFTMCIETGTRTRSHGLAIDIIKAQVRSLAIPLLTQNTSWSNYYENLIAKINYMKSKNIKTGVFGDIDIEKHYDWIQKLCGDTEIKACLPLWKKPRDKLISEFLSLGFKAIIIAVDANKLGKEYLGRALDTELIAEFNKLKIDPCGENGEYHTLVTDGPIFSYPLNLKKGAIELRSNYWFQDCSML